MTTKMLEIDDKIDGDYTFAADTDLNGMIAGNALVLSGVQVTINGMIRGDLVAEAGSRVTIHGMVSGVVTNRGADLIVLGAIDSLVDLDPSKPSTIDPGSRVKDREPAQRR
jgi:cytoskeletal protein CcmA (bactofilin family)